MVITHDNDLAAEMPRRVAIRDGRIVSDSGRAAPAGTAAAGVRGAPGRPAAVGAHAAPAGPSFPARPVAVGAQGAPDPTMKEQP